MHIYLFTAPAQGQNVHRAVGCIVDSHRTVCAWHLLLGCWASADPLHNGLGCAASTTVVDHTCLEAGCSCCHPSPGCWACPAMQDLGPAVFLHCLAPPVFMSCLVGACIASSGAPGASVLQRPWCERFAPLNATLGLKNVHTQTPGAACTSIHTAPHC